MISRNRLFTRQPPNRDAKSIYLFCEGVKRESQYFHYFKELDSRINIEIYPLTDKEDNSPKGLFHIALICLIKSEKNPNPKYELLEDDEVWIVLDTDKDKNESRKPQIQQLRKDCTFYNWHVAQSNPCFEVWLYYHFYEKKPIVNNELCKEWKQYLQTEKGGFDAKKHPLLFQTAIINAENNFKENEDKLPDFGTTEVYKIAKSILPLVKAQIDKV